VIPSLDHGRCADQGQDPWGTGRERSPANGIVAAMHSQQVGFQSDIRPLFRDKDVRSMSAAFDLSSYDDVKANAPRILAAVSNGSMPCDGPWPADRVSLLRTWVDAGCPA
jgi:hypothetical protein